jgi:hypothetical protein
VVRELSPFELDRELSRVVPRARGAYRALRAGREVTLTVPEVLRDPETLDRLAGDDGDPIAAPLLRHLYWLELMRRALPREGERMRRYRESRHALDKPLSGHFSWRELLGHALRDAHRRPALLDVLFARGDELRDAGKRVFELRAELPSFYGRARAELELPSPDIGALARRFLVDSRDAFTSLAVRSLPEVLELGLATRAADGWPRQLSLRSLHDLLGNADWFKGLQIDAGELPAPLSAASFVRGLLRLGSAWTEALAPTAQPFSIAHDAFRLVASQHGALLAGLPSSVTFVKRQLGLGKERSSEHVRALAKSALLFARMLALRVLLDEPSMRGPAALAEAFSELGTETFGFEPPPAAAGLLIRPRLGDAQRFAGLLLAAEQAARLADDHDDDWYRNPRAIEQLRAEARVPPVTLAETKVLERGSKALVSSLAERL